MKRYAILVSGLLACAAACGAVYLASTSPIRELKNHPAPELAWLREEFKLNDVDFKKVCELHYAYLPQCKELCARIAEKNARMRALMETSTNVTPEIQAALSEAAQLRAQCRSQMLNHFFQVSRTMPPAEGQRYLAWIRSQTLWSDGGMNHGGASGDHHLGHEAGVDDATVAKPAEASHQSMESHEAHASPSHNH